jgi:hypothetical protein
MDDDRSPGHPSLQAALLMIAVVVLIVVVSAAGVFFG